MSSNNKDKKDYTTCSIASVESENENEDSPWIKQTNPSTLKSVYHSFKDVRYAKIEIKLANGEMKSIQLFDLENLNLVGSKIVPNCFLFE
jgi:hypothetical protein